MDKEIVVFGEDWAAHPSSTQHLIRRLSARRKVLWINSIGMRRPNLSIYDGKRILKKLRSGVVSLRGQGLRGVQGAEGNVTVISPVVVPVPSSDFAWFVSRKILELSAARAARRMTFCSPILWLTLPSAVKALGIFREKAVVYYCGDDFRSMRNIDPALVMRWEDELARKADLVLAPSRVTAARFPREKTVFVPHGVDFELFSTPTPPARDLPLGKPTVGFYGALADWIDLELLIGVARRLPDHRFVLIGPILVDARKLLTEPNVYYLGPRPHEELPSYVQHWTVSLLPFRRNLQIRACNPLKLREYLAAGSPVVATDFPALDGYRDLVDVADGADDFAAAVALRSRFDGSEERARRRDRVRGESWESRALQIERLLSGLG